MHFVSTAIIVLGVRLLTDWRCYRNLEGKMDFIMFAYYNFILNVIGMKNEYETFVFKD